MKIGRQITIPADADLNQNVPPHRDLYGTWYEVIVGIGNDHVAYLTLDREALAALRNGEEIHFRDD